MATTWKTELETYPNLRSETLPWLIDCAKEGNTIQAEMAFKRYCPANFKIINVSWVKSRNEPYCRWRVDYNLHGVELLPEEGDELKKLFSLLEKYHPPNTGITNVQYCRNAVVEYGVRCKCDAPNFEMAEQSPKQLPWGTLLENIRLMKIVAEEKD